MQDRPKRDPVGAWLEGRLGSDADPGPGKGTPPWSPSVPRIALSALLLVLAGSALTWAAIGGLSLATRANGTGGAGRANGEVFAAPAGQVRVIAMEGEPSIARRGESRDPWVGDALVEGDAISAGPGSTLGLSLPGGSLLVIAGEALLDRQPGGRSGLLVRLESGAIAARILPQAVLGVEGMNALVDLAAGVHTVEASEGLVGRVSAFQGNVAVVRRGDGERREVAAPASLDVLEWTEGKAIARGRALRALVRLAGLDMKVEDDPAGAAAGPASPPAAAPAGAAVTSAPAPVPAPTHLTLAQQIRAALDGGDVEKALELAKGVPSKGEDAKDADLMIAAGDAYSQAGEWPEAAGMYQAAAKCGSGKEAERVFLRAADISFRKLGDPAGAASILAEYMARFPDGAYLDEALYLSGVVQAKLGNWKDARALLERYVTQFPAGVQTVRARLALAKILAFGLGDCAAAKPHVDAVAGEASGPAAQKEIAAIAKACGWDGAAVDKGGIK